MPRQGVLALVLLGVLTFALSAQAQGCDDLSYERMNSPGGFLPADGGSHPVRLYGARGCTYGMEAAAGLDEARWLYVDPASITLQGSEADVVTLRFEANPTSYVRGNDLIFRHASGFGYAGRVTQGPPDAPCDYQVSADRTSFPVEGGSGKVTVTYSGSVCLAPTFSATPENRIHVGPDGLFTVDMNTDGLPLYGYILASAPPRWAGESVTISQAGFATPGEDRPPGDGGVHDPLADALVNEEPGPEAALVAGGLALAALVARRRR